MNEIFSHSNVLKSRETFSYVFESLLWGHNYEFEIYAGSYYGVGKPAEGTIHRPKSELMCFMEQLFHLFMWCFLYFLLLPCWELVTVGTIHSKLLSCS